MAPRSTGRGRTVTLLFALSLALAALFPATVLAHAALDTVTPADGSTVEVAPAEIVMTFTQDVDQARSSIVIVTGGTEVASGGEVDPAEPRRMTLALPPLEPGAYEVRWTTFSAEDGEGPERGTTTFTFAPPPPTPTPTPPQPSATPAPTAAPTPSPTASPSSAPSPDTSPSGASTTDILIPIIAAVMIVGGFGYWLLRRRSGAGGTP